MAVKRSQSAARVLSVFEAVARRQPIGVSALARVLGEDKSAVQRALLTLADAGWIRMAPGAFGTQSGQWETTPHVLTFAHLLPHSSNDLRQQARGALERLRNATGETVFLTVPDKGRFLVIEALESRHVLRMTTQAGMVVPVRGSASGKAVLPYLSEEMQAEMLGEAPDAAMLAAWQETRARGYSLNDGEVHQGSVVLGAPVFGLDGEPLGAVLIAGPAERMGEARRAEFGALVMETARALSRGAPIRA